LAGYGLGTRIRATLARILIPGPATDPLLRIRGPGACLRARLFYGLLRTLFGLKFYLEKICSLALLKRGELRVKSGLKQEKLSVRPFKLHSSFYT